MPVLLILFLLFISIPLVEISVLGRVMAHLGIVTTLGLCVLTAAIGALLVRIEGIQTLQRMQATLQSGEIPAAEVLEGLALFLAGLMLLTPGFVTDALGFVILLPMVRRPVAAAMAGRLRQRSVRTESRRYPEEPFGAPPHQQNRQGPGRIIDVEPSTDDGTRDGHGTGDDGVKS